MSNYRNLKVITIQLILLIAFLLLLNSPLYSQKELPVLKVNSKGVDIRDGSHFKNDYWYIMPEKNPDLYFVEIPRKEHRVTFISDIDSISFNVKYGGKYDFIVLLNNKDTCYTQIIAAYRDLVASKKDCIECISDTIPFTVANNNKIHIKGKINNSKTLDFEFDLGAGGCLIKKASVDKMKMNFDDSINLINSDGINVVPSSSINTLKISNMQWDSLRFAVANNMSYREDGIVGNSLFRDKVVEINYERNLIIISDTLSSVPKGYSKHEILLDGVIPFIEISLVINNKEYRDWFMFDTGYSSKIRITYEFLKKHHLEGAMKKIWGFGKRNIFKAPEFLIGNYKFTGISIAAEKPQANTDNHSLLGNEMLKQFNIILDNQNGYIYLKPNGTYNAFQIKRGTSFYRILITAIIFLGIVMISYAVFRNIKQTYVIL